MRSFGSGRRLGGIALPLNRFSRVALNQITFGIGAVGDRTYRLALGGLRHTECAYYPALIRLRTPTRRDCASAKPVLSGCVEQITFGIGAVGNRAYRIALGGLRHTACAYYTSPTTE